MGKHVFEHMWSAKAQISLHICTVWSRPSLYANRIMGYYRMYHWRTKVVIRLCACIGWTSICAFCTCSKTPFGLTGPMSGHDLGNSVITDLTAPVCQLMKLHCLYMLDFCVIFMPMYCLYMNRCADPTRYPWAHKNHIKKCNCILGEEFEWQQKSYNKLHH